jgi:phage shock protein A
MQVWDRILTVARANLNSWLNPTQDPEKLLEKLVHDMQNDMLQLRQAVAQAIATQKRTERQCRQAKIQADAWQQRAEVALNQGQEHQAREALIHRKALLQNIQTLQVQIESQQGIVTKLKQDLKDLNLKLADARVKKDLYIARARSAQATQRMQEMLNRLNSDTGTSIFEQMEQRVLDLEAQSEAIEAGHQDDLEERFLDLERGDVEEELRRLRSRLASDPNSPLRHSRD